VKARERMEARVRSEGSYTKCKGFFGVWKWKWEKTKNTEYYLRALREAQSSPMDYI
jgi:hypothetical protein